MTTRPLTSPQRLALLTMQKNANDPARQAGGWPHLSSGSQWGIATMRTLVTNGLVTLETEIGAWRANLTDRGLRAELCPEGRGWVVVVPEPMAEEDRIGYMQGRGAS